MRRIFLSLRRMLPGIAGLWSLLAAVAISSAAEPVRPNILLIVADDLGYEDLGCQGQREVRTPNLDRLAAGGIRLTDFYVTWPACTPSRGSILTGRYPHANGLYDMIRNDVVNYGHKFTEAEYAVSPEMTLGLDEREVTLAQPLAKVGYACGMVGKWDSGRARRFLPLRAASISSTALPIPASTTGRTSAMAFLPCSAATSGSRRRAMPPTCSAAKLCVSFATTASGHSSCIWLSSAARRVESGKDRSPVPQEYVAMYPESLPAKRRIYLGSITCLDTAVGKILEELDKLGVAENTLIVFTSDNGGTSKQANGPLRGHKNELFEGGIRVPCLVRWPGHIPAGTVNHDLLTTLEFFQRCWPPRAHHRPA